MKRILIVDDAPTIRMYHSNILKSAGFNVEEAINGVEALEKTLKSPFDLYIVDINMPKLNGYEFLKELRSLDIEQKPVIMISTEAEEHDKQKALIYGANYYIVKPVKPEYLIAITNILIGVKV